MPATIMFHIYQPHITLCKEKSYSALTLREPLSGEIILFFPSDAAIHNMITQLQELVGPEAPQGEHAT